MRIVLFLSLLLAGCVVRQSTYEQALISLNRCHRASRTISKARDSKAESLKLTEQALIEARQKLAGQSKVCGEPRSRRLLELALALGISEADLRAIKARRTERGRRARLSSWMRTRFEPLIAQGLVILTRRDLELVLRVPASALFVSGRAALNAKGARVFAEIGRLLRERTGERFVIAGHTASGRARPYRDDWHLSSARARSVARALVAAGVEAGRLGVAGFGNHRAPAAKKQADRIEIRVLLGTLPATIQPPAGT